MMQISSQLLNDFARVRHWVLDLDGTIYKGDQLFDETLPILNHLQELGFSYTFLTNNTSLSRKDHLHKLRRMGISLSEDELCTPVNATMAWLREQAPDAVSLAIMGTASLCHEFEVAGWQVDWNQPDAIVVGFDTSLTYERLCRAAYWVQMGLPYVATHPDFVCPTNEPTVLIDCGAICACIAAATNRTPAVMGKPTVSMLLQIAAQNRLGLDELAVIGDRLYTDIAMAQNAGVPSILVLSGETTVEDLKSAKTQPSLVLSNIGELRGLLRNANRTSNHQE